MITLPAPFHNPIGKWVTEGTLSMSHIALRFILPGLLFWLPSLSCLLFASDLEIDVVFKLITIAAATTLPVGFLVYNDYRLSWLTKGGYEAEPFLSATRESLHRWYDPMENRVLLNFAAIDSTRGLVAVNAREFNQIFCPFESNLKNDEVNEDHLVALPTCEPVADLILFREESFDYARSVSTIRHSVDAAWHAAVIGLLFLAVTFPLYVSPNVGWWSLVKFVFCPLFGVILAGCIVKRVGQRRAFADSDYAARYLLLTVLNSSAYRVDELGTKDLPKGVTDWFDGQERRRSSFALLDMDETLIHGDVAESLLQLFEGNGWQPRLTGDTDGVDATRREVWKEYQRKLKESTNGAYRYSTSILEGMSPEDIAKHTNELLIQEYGGKLLRARPEAKALVRFLELSGIRCYVVTASNQWSAEVVAWNWFGIPRQRVIGVRPELEKSGCLGRLGEETQPIGAKKLDCFRSRTEVKTDPAVVAGDSESDLSLFNACRQDGLRILVGNNPRVESLINSPRQDGPAFLRFP